MTALEEAQVRKLNAEIALLEEQRLSIKKEEARKSMTNLRENNYKTCYGPANAAQIAAMVKLSEFLAS